MFGKFVFYGKVNLLDAKTILVKSWRSLIIFYVSCVINLPKMLIKKNSINNILLREIGVLPDILELSRIDGFFVIKDGTKRERKYLVVYGEESYFIKYGEMLNEEVLDELIVSELKKIGINSIVPIKKFKCNKGFCGYQYAYFSGRNYRQHRLNIEESRLFSRALNINKKIYTEKLDKYIIEKIKNGATDVFGGAAPSELLKLVNNIDIKIGRVHGDLYSANIIINDNSGDVCVIDWESFSESAPILLDIYGATSWQDFLYDLNIHKSVPLENCKDINYKERVAFLFIAALNGFKPAIDIIKSIK